jgi:CheY-like chemotaxis protein
MPQELVSAEALQAEALPAQRMAIVGQLTGGVVHDFNNILTVIAGTIEILADAVAGQPELEAVAGLISEAAARGASLTSHLLAFAHGKPSQLCDVDVNSLLVDAARLLRPTLGEQIEIDTVLAAGGSQALVDPSRLMAAILNLAIMARDAMPEGGKLTFETRNAASGEGDVGAKGEVYVGGDVVVAVNACSHGACGERPDRTFIDLRLVQDLIGHGNGDIEIGCEAGQGTSVKIHLPPASRSVQRRAEECRTGNGTILIVEDDILVHNYVVTQLRDLGYRTLSASNASEALAIVDSGESIDLLFTDLVMPGPINGRRLAVEARKRRPSLKVLYTSGYAENARIHDERLDADALLLAKPYRKIELAKMIRAALAPDAIQDRD